MEPDGLGDSAGITAFFATTGSLLGSGVALLAALAVFGVSIVDAAGAFAFEISLDAAFGGGV